MSSMINGGGTGTTWRPSGDHLLERDLSGIDGAATIGVVTPRAIETEGHEIPVSLTAGEGISLREGSGVARAHAAAADDRDAGPEGEACDRPVTIAGPAARSVLRHAQSGAAKSGVNVTDHHFGAPDLAGLSEEGADMLFGGGNVVVGEGGDDCIKNGARACSPSGGDDRDTLEQTGAGARSESSRVSLRSDDRDDGSVSFSDAHGNDPGEIEFWNIENVVPCFTPGTMIATPKGEVPVETLKPGDRVITRDNGIQDIYWVGTRALSFADLAKAEHLAPIHIRAGALGNGLPERDTMLSPNHRVLVTNDRTSLYFDEREVLAAAKYLVDSRGVRVVEPLGVTYLHFLCRNHEVVLSNGAWTESFQPGDLTLGAIGNAQRQELFEVFPELKTRKGLDEYGSARRVLTKHEAQILFRS